MKSSSSAALAVALIAGATSAFAQTQVAPNPPASMKSIPEKVAPPLNQDVKSGRSDSLSQKLDDSNGVIRPPSGIDPGMTKEAPVPHPHSTPVIKPNPSEGQPK